MTTYETLSLLISVAGSLGVIASLWLLYRQTGIFNQQLTQSISQSVIDYSVEISRIFLQHPDLRPYFFNGQAIEEGHPDYLRAEAVAEVMLDIMWTMANEAQRIQETVFVDTEARAQWNNYLESCFATSPLLTSFLTRRKDWYGEDMQKHMERGLARASQQTS